MPNTNTVVAGEGRGWGNNKLPLGRWHVTAINHPPQTPADGLNLEYGHRPPSPARAAVPNTNTVVAGEGRGWGNNKLPSGRWHKNAINHPPQTPANGQRQLAGERVPGARDLRTPNFAAFFLEFASL